MFNNDGKPTPTPEQIEAFLALCEDPMGRLWCAQVHKAALRAYKGDWNDKMSLLEAIDRLEEELEELKKAIAHGLPYEEVLYECADIANFCVVVEDLAYHAKNLAD